MFQFQWKKEISGFVMNHIPNIRSSDILRSCRNGLLKHPTSCAFNSKFNLRIFVSLFGFKLLKNDLRSLDLLNIKHFRESHWLLKYTQKLLGKCIVCRENLILSLSKKATRNYLLPCSVDEGLIYCRFVLLTIYLTWLFETKFVDWSLLSVLGW